MTPTDLRQLAVMVAEELARLPALMTRKEAAAFLRVSPSTFDQHVRPYVEEKRIGGAVRWARASLIAWLETSTAEQSAHEPGPLFVRSAPVPAPILEDDPRVKEILESLRKRRKPST